MTHRLLALTPFATLFATALVGGACTGLSQEDLLFRAALPEKREVALEVSGDEVDTDTPTTTRQALEADVACGDGDLRCHAVATGRGFNTLTFFLLDIVDLITAQPPTEREKGRRVWGPYFDADKGGSFRLEMTRDEDDPRRFHFCVHAGAGRVTREQAKDITCADDEHASGLALALTGDFAPGEVGQGARARDGDGNLHLLLQRIDGLRNAGGDALDIHFDNRDGGSAIDVDFVGQQNPISGESATLAYHFERDSSGAGEFHFYVFADFVAGPRLEELTIDAEWLADKSGAAHANVGAGEAGDGIDAYQCWAAAQEQTYFETSVDGVLQEGGCSIDPHTI